MTETSLPEGSEWRFTKFGLLVTGAGEREFVDKLFCSLMASRDCHFEIIAKIEQRSPIVSEKRLLKMVGSGRTIPDRDADEIGLPARHWIQRGSRSQPHLVILIDDLEHDRRPVVDAVFARYRTALDTMLRNEKWRASVHFFVPMLEAYYFAHTDVVNSVLSTSLSDHDGDVEELRHPKNELKKLKPGFDEKRDGANIVGSLDLHRVLEHPNRCRALRSMIGWCAMALRRPKTDEFQLQNGQYFDLTASQINHLNPQQ
jgi:hypothetical protein